MTPTAPPLAGTFDRLRRYDELFRAETGRPVGDEWLPLDSLSDDALDELFAAANRGERRHCNYLGASVAAALVDILTSTAMPPLLVERRLPDVAPSNLIVRLHHSEFWFQGVAVDTPVCWALPTDPEVDHPSVTAVTGVADLHSRFAAVLVDTAADWFAAVRARAPFGLRGMWGQLADDLCGSALWTAREAGLDQRTAWKEAQAIIDLVAAVVPELRVRPRLFSVQWSGGETLWQVKGTCCLWYTTFAEPDTCGDGYCNTCPLRPDHIRHARLADWLEADAATAAAR